MWRIKKIKKLVKWFDSESLCHSLEVSGWTWRIGIVRGNQKIEPKLDDHEKAVGG